MRVDRAERLIAAMEAAPDERFNMRYIFSVGGERTADFGARDPGQHSCGTAACIAGWGIWVAGDEIPPRPDGNRESIQVADWLEIGQFSGYTLFTPLGYNNPQGNGLTRLRAIAVLRDMVFQAETTGRGSRGRGTVVPRWENFGPGGEAV